MIGRKVNSNWGRSSRKSYFRNHGLEPDEPGVNLDGLTLGRIATKDFASCGILDRMLMYERWIENSLHKTLRELERRQMVRQYRRQEAEQKQSASEQVIPSVMLGRSPKVCGFEAVSHGDENKCDLKNKANLYRA